MTIYIDLVFMLNLFFDLLLLVCVKIVLKRLTSFIRLLLGALVGSLSTLLLFLKINSLELFAFKVLISLLMILVSFNYKNIRYFFKNFITLYIVSAFLGGFLYFLNIQFSYKQKGLIFINKGLSVNVIFLLLVSPIIIYIYIKENKILKINYSHYYIVKLILSNKKILTINGYLDTGNNLKDPVSKKSIIMVNRKLIESKIKIRSPIYVPYKSLNNNGLLECIKVNQIIINNHNINNVLIGLSNEKFNIDNVDCLLNNQLEEIINV